MKHYKLTKGALFGLLTLALTGCGGGSSGPIAGDWFPCDQGCRAHGIGYRFTDEGKWMELWECIGLSDRFKLYPRGNYTYSGNQLVLRFTNGTTSYAAEVEIQGDDADVAWKSVVDADLNKPRWRRAQDVVTIEACP